MAVLWKLNGSALADLPFVEATLQLVNGASGAADTLTLREVLENDDASDPLYAYGDEVTLERVEDGVAEVWFVGTVRDLEESVDRSRTTKIRGGMDALERKAYLQNFKEASDPTDRASALRTIKRGRVVLNQSDAGDRIALATFIESVLSYAGVAVGTINAGGLTVPFEDATDLSCAEVLQRLLRWIPTCVLWFDYGSGVAVCHLAPRSALTVAPLTIGQPAGVTWALPLRLRPRHDLQVDHVRLIYVATNRANDASWEVALPNNGPLVPPGDLYPPGTTGEEPGALVRTIELGGSVESRSYLTQEVDVTDIPAALDHAALLSGWVKNASPNETIFASLSTWWKEHRPELQKTGVEIVAFRSGTRTNLAGGAVTAGLKELVGGAIADWMEETVEEQLVEVDIAYTVTTKDDAGATKKQPVIERLTARIVATSASSKSYRQLADGSFTEGEEVPTGLAEALYDGLHALQYEGEIPLVEAEASAWPAPGQVVNLLGGRAAWATMLAVVQSRTTEIGSGRTTIQVGPPTDLSANGLLDIYRTNRNRRPSTSYLVRHTGKTGGATGGPAAPLPVAQPIKPSQPSTRVAPRVYTQALTVAGVVPTAAEITTALQTVFPATNPPVQGDIVNLTVGGVTKLRAAISAHGTTSGLYQVSFVWDGRTYYALVQQTGLY